MPEQKQINTKTILSYLGKAFTVTTEWLELVKQLVSFGGLNTTLQSESDVKQGGLNDELVTATTVKIGGLD